MATGGSARGADGARRRCPPQAQKDGRNVPNNPVTKTVVAAGLGRGAYAGSANKSKPDGNPVPFAKRKGTRRAKPRRRGCPFKVRANGLLPGKRLSASLDGRGYSTSKRGESSDDGGSLSECLRRADGLATSAVLDY